MRNVPEMTDQEKDRVRAWIQNWREIGPMLENLKRGALKRVDTAEAIAGYIVRRERVRAWSSNNSGLNVAIDEGLV